MVLHSNTDFIILAILVHFLTILGVNHGYSFKCPQAVHWNVRSKDMCIEELKYVCLYDDVKKNITESCNGPLPTIAKGYTWLVRGNPDRGRCSPGTYQPIKHRNVKSSDCVYKKSLCSEEGQVVFDTGNTTDDQTCRCDYRRGYDFVVKPRKRCYCYPLEEECSCYKRQCDNTNTSLSQDYQCKDNYTTITVCPPMKTDFDKGFQSRPVIKYKDYRLENDWIKILITILIVCSIVVSPIVLQQRRQKYQYLHRDIFLSQLKSQTCDFGEDVKFECKLNVNVGMSHWFKETNELEIPCHWKTESNCQNHSLVIYAVSFEDEGQYSIKVKDDTSQAKLIVNDTLLIKSEDIHYILSVHAICKIALPAVRNVFDKVIEPDTLSDKIHKNKEKLRHLLKKNYIIIEQQRLLFDNCSQLTSKMFDLRLMVFLLRHIAEFKIKNSLPPDTDESEVADLCRIDYYRNMLAHYQGRMTDTDFKQCLKVIMEAAKRLNGKHNDLSTVGKISKQVWSDHLNKSDKLILALTDVVENEPEVIKEMVRNIDTEEINYLRIVHLLHSVGCPAVRYKFNRICRPADLEQLLNKKRICIELLEQNSEITPSQFKLLFPDKGKASSKKFGLKLMLILMINLSLSPVTKHEMRALMSLEEYLHTFARSNSGQVSDKEFVNDWNKICEAIILLGGDLCGKRFKNMCCFLRPESSGYLENLVFN